MQATVLLMGGFGLYSIVKSFNVIKHSLRAVFYFAQILRIWFVVGMARPSYHVYMNWTYYNPNPIAARVGDCTVRAISKVLDQDWEDTYMDLCALGLAMCDLPSANSVWGRIPPQVWL